MEKQFELTLTNHTKNVLVILGGMALLMSVLVNTAPLFTNTTSFGVIMAVMFGGGLLGIFLVARRLGGVPTVVTVAQSELRVLNRKSGIETRMAFDSIASYSTSFFNGWEELWLKSNDDSHLKLAVNTRIQDLQVKTFWEMVRTFEAALLAHQQQQGVTPVSLKENEFSFFASALSTVVLVLLVGGWGWAAWQVIANRQAVGSGFFLLCFSFIVYAGLWYNSRALRQRG